MQQINEKPKDDKGEKSTMTENGRLNRAYYNLLIRKHTWRLNEVMFAKTKHTDK